MFRGQFAEWTRSGKRSRRQSAVCTVCSTGDPVSPAAVTLRSAGSFLEMTILTCSQNGHQGNLVVNHQFLLPTESPVRTTGESAQTNPRSLLCTHVACIFVCVQGGCGDSGILACNHRRGHSYPPIPPSCPHSQYKGYSPQSALIQMIFNIPAPLLPVLPVLPVLPGPGHYQLLLMEAARYQ